MVFPGLLWTRRDADNAFILLLRCARSPWEKGALERLLLGQRNHLNEMLASGQSLGMREQDSGAGRIADVCAGEWLAGR